MYTVLTDLTDRNGFYMISYIGFLSLKNVRNTFKLLISYYVLPLFDVNCDIFCEKCDFFLEMIEKKHIFARENGK